MCCKVYKQAQEDDIRDHVELREHSGFQGHMTELNSEELYRHGYSEVSEGHGHVYMSCFICI